MSSGGKATHIEPDFRDNDAGHGVTNRGDCHHSIDGVLKGREGGTQARLHVAHGDLEPSICVRCRRSRNR